MNLSTNDQQRAILETRELLARLSVSSQIFLYKQASVDDHDYLEKISTAYYQALQKAVEENSKTPQDSAEARKNASSKLRKDMPSLGFLAVTVVGAALAGVGCAHIRSIS